ncbi:hypothetical protein B0T21DRAFT_325469 [Apiosordaria backusii]|uniref:Uncharacterized protein n=1 Tax=Apiosordaria backusii TaxID=314023 RepID=A0AA40ESF5_9PEZI|nr:hypothetical protein B0T21DRAFT_325469 [Apiosordaria backusii]
MFLNKLYSEYMKHHAFGYALYHPTLNSAINIGACGYFDESDNWNPIGNIADQDFTSKFGLDPIDKEELEQAPTDKGTTWDCLLAAGTKGRVFSIEARATLMGIPVGAKAGIEYTSESKFGAVLVPLPPIHHDAYYFMSPFQDWVCENAAALMKSKVGKDVREHGLCIITQTYATPKCTMTAWNRQNGSVSIGFDVKAKEGIKLGIDTRWYEGKSVEGWRSYEAEGDDLRVVFVGGLRCTFRKEPWATIAGIVRSKKTLRGTRGTQEPLYALGSEEENEGYKIECELYGEVARPRKEDPPERS